MIVTSFLFLTLLVAFIAVCMIYRAAACRNGLQMYAGLCLSLFIYLYGTWIFISAYSKYALGVAVPIAVLSGLNHQRSPRRAGIGYQAFLLVFAMLMLALDVLYYTGVSEDIEYADLRFPFKGKRYYVFQGGKGLPANGFHFHNHRATYAMDIVKLDNLGRRCHGLFSRRLADYYIFGDTIFSPCDGIVRRATNNNPDNIPPRRERGPNNLNGVLIECDEYFVFLGHMQHNRVFVKPGQRIKVGAALGLAGNSGMSLEPHLHIQVHKKAVIDGPWYMQPQLFIRFDGKTHLLFEVIEPQTSL